MTPWQVPGFSIIAWEAAGTSLVRKNSRKNTSRAHVNNAFRVEAGAARNQAPVGMTFELQAPQNKGAVSGQQLGRGEESSGPSYQSLLWVAPGVLAGFRPSLPHCVFCAPAWLQLSEPPVELPGPSVWCLQLAPALALLFCLDLFFW